MSDERDPMAPRDPVPGAPIWRPDDADLEADTAAMASSDAAMAGSGSMATSDAAMAAQLTGSLVPPSAEELAALAAATAAAIPMPRDVAGEEAAQVQAAAEAAHAKRTSGRRVRVGRFFVRMATFALTLALLASGVALGAAAFQRTQPPPVTVGDASTGGVAAPPVVKELTDALQTNNADSIRSAVSTGPYEKLAAELQQWDIKGVTSVETLATMQDGTRSATEIIIRAKTSAGNPLIINLVVHVDANKIVNFR
jgi:hypothetical protein